MKKEKTIILYSNDIGSYDFDDVKSIIEEERWLEEDDTPVTDRDVYDRIHFYQDCDWQEFEAQFERYINSRKFVAVASIGHWTGRRHGYKMIDGWDGFITCIQHLDYLTIKDVNGKLIVEGSHHDGDDCIEFRELTRKGEELVDYYDYSIESLVQNFYSKYPRLAKQAW